MTNPMEYIRKSMSMKLSMGFLLRAVPIFVVALALLFLQSRYFIGKEARQRATSELDNTMQRLRTYLQTIETATNANEWLVMKDLRPETLLDFSRRVVMMNRNVNGCSITMEPGVFPGYEGHYSAYSIVAGDSVETVREKEYNYEEKSWYRVPKMMRRACWVEPFNDYNAGTLYTTAVIASYCKPLFREDSTLVGVMSTDIALSTLNEALKTESPYPGAYYMLVGKEGHFFVHPDSTLLLQHTIFGDELYKAQEGLKALGEEMTKGHEGNMIIDVDGKSCLVCYQPVPNTRWSLALVWPMEYVIHSYQKLMLVTIALALIGLLAMGLLCRRIVNSSIRPLELLLRQSEQIAKGRYDRRIERSRRRDAVGKLQNSFASMQQSLDEHLTAIEQANEDTRQSNEELIQATLLAKESDAQKTAFIQNMTHQVRTPLNIIQGFAQVLRDGMSMISEEEVKSITGTMDHNAKHLNRMVLMLYDSSVTGIRDEEKMKKDETPVRCNETIRECIDFTNEHFPEIPIRFDTTLDEDYAISTNRLYLMRSVRELLYNSAKYSDGKNLAVRMSGTESGIRIVVEDTGRGIPTDYQSLMYTPFTKVNYLSEGLGLGLPLTMRHVHNLGGEMRLDRDYHEGCRFIIDIPR